VTEPSKVVEPPNATRYPGLNRLEVDLGAIAHNVRAVRGTIGHDVQLFAVVKGNAYGLGVVEVAGTALSAGADALALVHVRDAIALRQAGVEGPILLYGGTLGDPALVQAAEHYDLTATVVDLESAQVHSRLARESVRVFVEVDVGLERLGIPADEAPAIIRAILRLPGLRVRGIYSHLRVEGTYHGGDGPAITDYVAWQFDRFSRVLRELRSEGIVLPTMMAASSPLVRLTRSMNLNAVDTGRLLYGLVPEVPAEETLDLRPALRSLTSRLVQVKDLRRDDFLDELDFSPRDVTRVGVIPMGLGDGLADVTCGEVLVRGRRKRLLGLSLEHARIDLTGLAEARAGDEVVIVGEQQGSRITSEEVFTHQNLRMPAGLGVLVRGSVERVYV
jgi:alanine racemase